MAQILANAQDALAEIESSRNSLLAMLNRLVVVYDELPLRTEDP